MTNAQWILIMGVAGSGKTTVGQALAAKISGTFLDADDLHPQSNIDKMSRGEPLTDQDRAPWLAKIVDTVKAHGDDAPLIVACSALKAAYRDTLAAAPYQLVYLKGSAEDIAPRLENRTDHFMPRSLLDSQFAALEEPEGAIVAPVTWPVDQIVEHIAQALDTKKPAG